VTKEKIGHLLKISTKQTQGKILKTITDIPDTYALFNQTTFSQTSNWCDPERKGRPGPVGWMRL
jgi:hypothetical protein